MIFQKKIQVHSLSISKVTVAETFKKYLKKRKIFQKQLRTERIRGLKIVQKSKTKILLPFIRVFMIKKN